MCKFYTKEKKRQHLFLCGMGKGEGLLMFF